jgi:hypothetical protein
MLNYIFKYLSLQVNTIYEDVIYGKTQQDLTSW